MAVLEAKVVVLALVQTRGLQPLIRTQVLVQGVPALVVIVQLGHHYRHQL